MHKKPTTQMFPKLCLEGQASETHRMLIKQEDLKTNLWGWALGICILKLGHSNNSDAH